MNFLENIPPPPPTPTLNDELDLISIIQVRLFYKDHWILTADCSCLKKPDEILIDIPSVILGNLLKNLGLSIRFEISPSEFVLTGNSLEKFKITEWIDKRVNIDCRCQQVNGEKELQTSTIHLKS